MASHPISIGGASASPTELPSMPDAALLLGQVFRCLGGWLSIDSRGRRGLGSPLCFDGDFPQLPDADQREQFRTSDEYRGAIKLLEGLMRRLGEADQEYLFLMLALEAVDESGFTPSIEEPRRGR